VPAVCLLDPDGDVVRHLQRTGTGHPHPGWACYHTDMWVTRPAGTDLELGVIGCAVGAPFAVLVAEQLRVSGCRLLISVTSAGQIIPLDQPPYFVLLERAWRDEGTSHHYMPPIPWAHLAPHLAGQLTPGPAGLAEPMHRGVSWTTDAPYRETPTALAAARAAGCHTVEMEAAALYAYAQARRHDVVCVAHVTNTMAVNGNDFDKGDNHGTHQILTLAHAIAGTLHRGDVGDDAASDTRTPPGREC
jgi:uridine phosphorylase